MNNFISRLFFVSSMTALFFCTFITTASANIVSGASSIGNNTSNGSTSLIIGIPASVSAGDFLIATIAFDKGASTTISTPSGWTPIFTTNNGTKTGVATFYRFAGASEPSNYTWTLTPSRKAVGGIVKYTGVDNSNPIYTTSDATGHSATAGSPSITTSDANYEIVAIFSLDDNRSLNTSSGMTEKFDVSNPNSNGPAISLDDKVQLLAGTVPASSINLGNPIRRWVAQQIVLKPIPPVGVLQVTKTVINNNVGTSTASSFSFKIGDGPIEQFNSDGVNNHILSPGTYSVVETPTIGYSAQYNNCNNINVSMGATTTCSIINDDLPGALLTVRKIVVGGSAVPSDFNLSVNLTQVQSGQQNFFESGAYNVNEQGPSNYRTVYSGDCDVNGNISIGSTGVKTCVSTSYIIENTLALCTNGIDDDSNDYTDMYDSSCHQFIPNVHVSINIINEEGESSTGTSGWIALYATDGNIPGASNTDHNYGLEQWGSLSVGINPGPYHIVPRFSSAGYNLTMSPDCSGTIVVGDSKMCVITLTAITPLLTIVKHVNNNNGGTAISGDFIINISGTNLSTSTFPGSETGTTVTLHSGLYSVTDTGPSGYNESFSQNCSGSIGLGETKTCTIASYQLETTENALQQCIDGVDNDLDGSTDLYDADCAQYLPHVNVVISIINEEGESSIGTAGWITLYATDGNLPGASNTDHNYGLEQWGSLSATINLGPYHVTPRFSSTGYNLTMSPECSGTIAAGDSKMCVITLTAIPPQLTIVKHVNNAENGTATASDFIISITGTNVSTSTFLGSETGTIVTLHSGSYSVTDIGPTGYNETFSNGCAGNIGIGESKTCTITSSDVPLVENSLSLCTDNIDNDLDGSTDLYDSDCAQYIPHVNASINIINEEGESSVGTSGWVALYATAGDLPGAYNPDRNYGLEGWGSVAATVNLGPFHVTPRFAHDGYTLTMSDDCSGTLVAGDSKICVVTLTAIPPQLTIVKHVVNNNGGIAVPINFTMNVSGTNVSTPVFAGSETGTIVTLHSGSYNVTESGPSGYTVLSGTNCSGSISLGESRTCTITNDDLPPALILIKKVINDNSGTATTTDWNLSADGPMPISGYGFVTSEVSNGFMKGTYTLSESGTPSGYSASPWSCIGDITNIGNSITIDIGQNATCTITNDDNP